MNKLISIILIITFTLTTELIIPPFVKGGMGGFAFASDKITPHPPIAKQSPAIEEEVRKKGFSWWWILLGVAVAGGAAAAAGGGSSSSSSSGGGSSSSGPGSATVSW